MKYFTLISSIILLVTYGIYGQITDNIVNKTYDTANTRCWTENQESVMQKILILESENINTITQMLNILNEKVRKSEMRIDSLLNWFNVEVDTITYLQAIPLSLKELQDAETYFSIDKAKRNPLSVIKLDLSRNALTIVPAEIEQFKNLQKLILSDNLLTELPSWINELVSLQYLYLSNNHFEELPTSLTEMDSLILIDLSYNPIWKGTSGIKIGANLKVLKLHDTKINYKEMQRLLLTYSDIIIK